MQQAPPGIVSAGLVGEEDGRGFSSAQRQGRERIGRAMGATHPAVRQQGLWFIKFINFYGYIIQ